MIGCLSIRLRKECADPSPLAYSSVRWPINQDQDQFHLFVINRKIEGSSWHSATWDRYTRQLN